MTLEERADLLCREMGRDPRADGDAFHVALFHIRAAVAAEREACAKLAEGADIICNIVDDAAARARKATTIDTGRMIARAILRRP